VEVLGSCSGPERVEGRLVPYLEAPLANLVTTVSLDQVRRHIGDEGFPPLPVLRWRHDRVVGEHGLGGSRARSTGLLSTPIDDGPIITGASEPGGSG
jgi:hypothetical protein